jgi:hypothetical protein
MSPKDGQIPERLCHKIITAGVLGMMNAGYSSTRSGHEDAVGEK